MGTAFVSEVELRVGPLGPTYQQPCPGLVRSAQLACRSHPQARCPHISDPALVAPFAVLVHVADHLGMLGGRGLLKP